MRIILPPLKACIFRWWDFLFRDDKADSSLRAPSIVGPTPTWNPCSAAGIFLSQRSKFTSPLTGQTPTRKQPWIQLCCWDFPYSKVKNLQVSLTGLPTFENNTVGLPNHSQNRSIIPTIEISTPERHNHINSKRTTIKQAIHIIISIAINIYVFYSKESLHSEYILLNTYLITSNKSNAKFYYASVFTFFERNTDDLGLIPQSCCYIQPHLWTPKTRPPRNVHRKARPHSLYHCSETSEEDPGGSFTKIKVPPVKDLLLSIWTCLQGSQTGTALLRASQGEWQGSPRSRPKPWQHPSSSQTPARHGAAVSNQDGAYT